MSQAHIDPMIPSAEDTTLVTETAAGKVDSLMPLEADVTTQQAATILNVSLPHLTGMIEKGLLPSRMVENQRRLPLQDIIAYKTDNRAKRRTVLTELAAHDQALGLE